MPEKSGPACGVTGGPSEDKSHTEGLLSIVTPWRPSRRPFPEPVITSVMMVVLIKGPIALLIWELPTMACGVFSSPSFSGLSPLPRIPRCLSFLLPNAPPEWQRLGRAAGFVVSPRGKPCLCVTPSYSAEASVFTEVCSLS